MEEHDDAPSMFSISPVWNMASFWLGFAVSVWSWQAGHYWLTVLSWIWTAHFGHTILLALHEASHYTLSPNRWNNEIRGFLLGASIGVPLSVFRQMHRYHHSKLATADDPELWPYSDPRTSRWFRTVMALLELTCGIFYTPILFFRGVLLDRKMPRDIGRRIALEYGLTIVIWSSTLYMVARNGWWEMFIVGYLIPAIGAANLHSWRKFVEHMGLFGATPLAVTRTVASEGDLLARLTSATMLHIGYHGTHHRFGKLAYHELPTATAKAYTTDAAAVPIFPSYYSAWRHMLPALVDPKCGSVWTDASPSPVVEIEEAELSSTS